MSILSKQEKDEALCSDPSSCKREPRRDHRVDGTLLHSAVIISADRVSEWSGRAGGVFVVLAEGFVLFEYANGQINGRQAATFTARFVGGAGGAWAGATAGASTGAAVGGFIGVWIFGAGAAPGAAIGGTIGGILGGIGGSWGGSALAGWAADSYFQFKDDDWGRQQRVDLLQFLSLHYATK